MKKFALVAVAASGLLALAGPAQAKEIGSLKVCGANGCNTFTDREALRGWEQSGAGSSQPAAAAQRYYTVELGFTDGETIIHRESAYWLPDGALFRFRSTSDSSWWSVAESQTAMYEKAAAGVEAFTPTLSRVKVKGRIARDPNSYLKLLGNLKYATLGKAKLHPIRITLTSPSANPWVNGTVILGYDAKQRLLIRPDGYFRLPAALGKLVLARASLNTKTSGSGGGNDVLLAGLGIGAVAAFGVLGLAKLRKMT
jgi:hypothetical protein